jgi:hypothetical protein
VPLASLLASALQHADSIHLSCGSLHLRAHLVSAGVLGVGHKHAARVAAASLKEYLHSPDWCAARNYLVTLYLV